jgi:hypothetical protein
MTIEDIPLQWSESQAIAFYYVKCILIAINHRNIMTTQEIHT